MSLESASVRAEDNYKINKKSWGVTFIGIETRGWWYILVMLAYFECKSPTSLNHKLGCWLVGNVNTVLFGL